MQLLNVQIHILHTSPIFDGDVHKSRNLQIGRLNGATPTIDFFSIRFENFWGLDRCTFLQVAMGALPGTPRGVFL